MPSGSITATNSSVEKELEKQQKPIKKSRGLNAKYILSQHNKQ